MGNANWGIIDNQSKREVAYMLHQTELTASEAALTKRMGVFLTRFLKVENPGAIGVAIVDDIRSIQGKMDDAYTLKPRRMTAVGLQSVDFEKFKFITIFANNENILVSGKVSSYEDLRIRIESDLSVKYISEDEVNRLKRFADSTPIEKRKCPYCNERTDVLKSPQVKCNDCNGISQKIQVCPYRPSQHFFCPVCSQAHWKQIIYEKTIGKQAATK